jgi:hypothetical protein
MIRPPLTTTLYLVTETFLSLRLVTERKDELLLNDLQISRRERSSIVQKPFRFLNRLVQLLHSLRVV